MDTFFLCLANSYKHGGRCIAGVELSEWKDSIKIICHSNGAPKWIRPISRDTDAGAIPNEVAITIGVMDVVMLLDVEKCPAGAQCENVYFSKIINIGKSFDKYPSLLDGFVDNNQKQIFYNHGKAVKPDIYNLRGDHSILLIKTENSEVYGDTTYTDYPRFRVKFFYKGDCYDFPITDPYYIQGLREKIIELGSKDTLYITCSLGVVHEGWHPKLAACIIEPIEEIHTIDKSNKQEKAYSVEEIRKTHNLAYAKWTLEADSELGLLYEQGWSIEQLMEHFGRNEGGIRSRLKKIGKIPF